MKKVTGFSLDEEVIQRLDETRGLASRSAVVEDLLKKGLGIRQEGHNG